MFYIQKVHKHFVYVVDTTDGVRESVYKILPKMPKNSILGNRDGENGVVAVSNKELLDIFTATGRIKGTQSIFVIDDACVLRKVLERGTRYDIPYGVEKIMTQIPSTCETVVLPTSLTELGSKVFSECCYLEDLVIPNSVTMIGTRTFFDTGLKKVVIPDSVRSIGSWCFSCCVRLQEVVVSKNIRILPDSCFTGCFELKKITIPEGIETIDCACFENCMELGSLRLPSTLRRIQSRAFAFCINLSRVEVLSDNIVLADDIFIDVDLAKITIVGHKGSCAEKYAVRKGMHFECLSED